MNAAAWLLRIINCITVDFRCAVTYLTPAFSKRSASTKTLFMNKRFPFGSSSLLIALSVVLFSCSSVQRFQQDTYNARNPDRKNFLEKKDGTVIEADEAVLRTPLFGKSTIELDRNTKVPVKEIVAYQNNSAYYRRIDGQFGPRIKRGLINMYQTTETYQSYNAGPTAGTMGRWRTQTRIMYHLQKGDSAVVERFTPAVTRNFVQDYAPAMEFINVYDANRRSARIWSVVNTTAVLGGILLVMSNGIKDEKLTGAGYAGVGLTFTTRR
jgi:hypothetical protein